MAKVELSNKEAKEFLRNLKSNQLVTNKKETKGTNMNNKLLDLNNYLFEQLERLNDDDMSDEQVEKEIKKANAVTNVARAIIDNAEVELKAMQFFDDRGYEFSKSSMLVFGGEEQKQIGVRDAD